MAELRVEYMGMTGNWEGGLTLGERSIASARALNQRAALARLLAWTAMIYVGRGDTDRAIKYVDEARDLSGADRSDGHLDIHSVMPVHCAWASCHLAKGEYEETVRVCEAGIAIADRTGYRAWPVHRLLPLLGESYLWVADVEGATRVAARLRSDSEQLGHRMGLAWAEACEAMLEWMRGDAVGAIESLRAAAARLEAIGIIPDAARVRRQLAARLRDRGDREDALAELRRAHDVLARIGAERELVKTRDQIRELGARPPLRGAGPAAAELSSRELEIARLVAQRQSNKSIARVLDISPRTVGTHLSNIFRKLEVESRAELVEVMRGMATPGA